MKYLFVFIFSLIFFIAHANENVYQHWVLVKTEKDSTIKEEFSRVKIIVNNTKNLKNLKNVEITLNEEIFLGKTNSDGIVEAVIPSGENRICADTQRKNSYTFYPTFKSQFSYEIRVFLNKKKTRIRKKRKLKKPTPMKKPVIYLYPPQTEKISVIVELKGHFTFTYPKYTPSGWNVTANPKGEIMYNNRTYNYLFWEGESVIIDQISTNSGFIVHSDTLVPFLETTLTKIGLTNIEQADFITYWAPILEQNELNFLHFEFNEGYEQFISKMTITPEPDCLIRVFMTYKPIIKPFNIKPQIIPSYNRNGFVVVEWGGSEIMFNAL